MKSRLTGCILALLALFAAAAAGGDGVRMICLEMRKEIGKAAALYASGDREGAARAFAAARDDFEAGRFFLESMTHHGAMERAGEKFAAVGEGIAGGGDDDGILREMASLREILREIAESDLLSAGNLF